MFCKWACTISLHLDFGNIPHKVNMAANTIVSRGTHSKRDDMRGGAGNAKWARIVATAITLSNGNYLVLCTRLFYSLTCRFPPETIHWSWKLSPSIFICQPESTTQVGSTFVFLVVRMSPGSRVPPVLFPCGKWLRGSGNGGPFFASGFSVGAWWHISLQLWLALHTEQAWNFTAKMIDEWLSVEYTQECYLE